MRSFNHWPFTIRTHLYFYLHSVMVLSLSMAKRKGCVIGWRMNKKYGMGSDGNTSVRMCPVITCICDRPNHNHKLYLPRSKIQTCLHHSYLSLGQSLHLFLSGLDQQLNNLRCLHWFWNLPLDPLASPFPSFIVPFPIPSPNLGLLWLLAHLGDSLSIICHHQCSGGQSCGLPCNYCAHRSVPH